MSDNTQVNKNKLYVGNLPYSMSEDDLREMFGQYGQVTQVTLITDKMSGRSKGFGFVEFSDEAAATAAAEATNGQDVNGRALMVNVARPQMPRENRPGGFGGGSRGGFGGSRGGSRGGFGGGGRGGYSNNRGGDRGGYDRGGDSY
jgi:RNA recognition motif-containing protein